MANQQKYFIGPSLLSDIRSTIQRVDAIAPRTSGPAQEVRLQMLQQPERGRDVRVGKTDGKWAFGTCATITIFEEIPQGSCPLPTASNEQIQNVINLTRDVQANSWVVIFRAPNGRWHLAEAQDRFAIRVGKVSADWAIGTCATVTLWSRTDSNCAPTASSPTETIEAVANLSYDVPANAWVVIGQGTDGKWYLLDSGIEGSCRQTIGGEDVTKLAGWDGTKVQLLGHDANGCLKWFDIAACAAPTEA